MPHPNLIVITLHDTGRHFGCYGIGTVHSPNIDRLAAEGVRCSSMFCASPVCSPSRGAMNTGRYPQRNGLMGLTHEPWRWRLHDDEQHIAQILGAAGYQSVVARIQHEDPDHERLGFENAIAQGDTNGPDAAREIAGWLEQREDARPFYLQFGMWETHTAYDRYQTPSDDSTGVTIPEWVVDNDTARTHFAGLQGAVRCADEAVGIVLDALDRLALADDTLVVFTVDHGVEIAKRAKWSCYDPGLEIAYLARWPGGGVSGGRVLDWVLVNVDHCATALELLGIDAPATLDGPSFAAGLRGDADAAPVRDYAFAMFQGGGEPRAVRSRSHKLIRNFAPGRYARMPIDLDQPGAFVWGAKDAVELYDLQADPNETDNLADDPAHAAVRAELDRVLADHLRELDDPILRGPVQTPYHRDAVATLPPAT